MTKHEYFIQSVENLPARSRTVIKALDITCDNIYSFSYANLIALKNCGKSTALEIINLAKNMRELFDTQISMDVEAIVSEEQFLFNSYELSIRARHALDALNIHDFYALKNEVENKFKSARTQRNIGRTTIRELYDFYEYIEQNCVDKTNRILDSLEQYNSVKSCDLDVLLDDLFKQLYQQRYPSCRAHIDYVYKSFYDVVSIDITNVHINDPSKSKREMIKADVINFRKEFLLQANYYYNMTSDELRKRVMKLNLRVFDDETIVFVEDFYEKEKHFPMFHLLCKAFLYKINAKKNENTSLYADYIGLFNDKKSLTELSQIYPLSRVRIKQIIDDFIESGYIDELPFVDDDSWKYYTFLNSEFLSIENTNFCILSQKEHLNISFYAFCQLCILISHRFSVLEIYQDERGNLSSTLGAKKTLSIVDYSVYACRNEFADFDFVGALQFIQKQVQLHTAQNREISIFELCREYKFWNNKVDYLEFIPTVSYILNAIIENLLHIQVVDGIILIEAGKIDVKQFLVDYINGSPEPVSPEELFMSFKEMYPDTSQIGLSQIRYYLTDRETFAAIGGKSLYTMAEKRKNVYRGSLFDCVISVLKESNSPLRRDAISSMVLELRPDSNTNSIRSVISTMIKTNRLKIFNYEFVGLPKTKYNSSFKQTKQESRFSFEARLEQIRKFVEKNHRLPFTCGEPEEVSLGLWYNRTPQNTTLTTQQMMDFFNFQQEVTNAMIPQTAEQYSFQQNCIEYKAIVMRTGELVNISENKRLFEWLRRACGRYSEITDVRKYYFDELIFFLSAFGFELDLH